MVNKKARHTKARRVRHRVCRPVVATPAAHAGHHARNRGRHRPGVRIPEGRRHGLPGQTCQAGEDPRSRGRVPARERADVQRHCAPGGDGVSPAALRGWRRRGAHGARGEHTPSVGQRLPIQGIRQAPPDRGQYGEYARPPSIGNCTSAPVRRPWRATWGGERRPLGWRRAPLVHWTFGGGTARPSNWASCSSFE